MTVTRYPNSKIKRAFTVRSGLHGTASKPRLSIYRSHQHLQAQLIDDDRCHTILGLSTTHLKKIKNQTKTDLARQLGAEFAKLALKQKISKAVFDRGGNRYHGRIKTFAESVRTNGLSI